MIQIRHVPDQVHREIKARAALAGMSLSDYLLAEMKRLLERPTREQMLKRLAGLTPVRTRVRAADVIRAERDSR